MLSWQHGNKQTFEVVTFFTSSSKSLRNPRSSSFSIVPLLSCQLIKCTPSGHSQILYMLCLFVFSELCYTTDKGNDCIRSGTRQDVVGWKSSRQSETEDDADGNYANGRIINGKASPSPTAICLQRSQVVQQRNWKLTLSYRAKTRSMSSLDSTVGPCERRQENSEKA